MDVVEDIAQLGVDVVEINTGILLTQPQWFTDVTVDGLLEKKAQYGLEFSLHLPFHYIHVSNPIEAMREASVRAIADIAARTEPIDPIHYVLHLTNGEARKVVQSTRHSDEAKQRYLQRLTDQAKRSVRSMKQFLDGRRICIENLQHIEPPLPCEDVIGELGTSMCYDVGHAIKAGLDPVEYFLKNEDVIQHMHFHDVVADEEGNLTDHQALGMGIVDAERFVGALRARAYQGTMLLEVDSPALVRQSVQYLKQKQLF